VLQSITARFCLRSYDTAICLPFFTSFFVLMVICNSLLLLKSLPINIINCIKFYVNCSALTGMYDWQYKYLFVCLYANHLPWYIAVRICFSNSGSAHFHVSWLSYFIFYQKPLYKSLHQSFFYSFITILPSESGIMPSDDRGISNYTNSSPVNSICDHQISNWCREIFKYNTVISSCVGSSLAS
jgi:hypothetical protein